MSNATLLGVGYAFVTLVYGAYWVSLRLRIRALERKVRR